MVPPEGFAEHDDDSLQLTPEREDTRKIAPDEPFRPDMILVPIVCGVCKLRLYAQEKHVGLWTACPDCGRLNEIRPVDPLSRYVVETNSAGTLELKSMADYGPNAAYRANVDYTAVTGSIDLGAEPIPFYGLDETSEDCLENWMDRVIESKSKGNKTKAEQKYDRLTAEETRRKEEAKKVRTVESPSERQTRLLAELAAKKASLAKAAHPEAKPNLPLTDNIDPSLAEKITAPQKPTGQKPPASRPAGQPAAASQPAAQKPTAPNSHAQKSAVPRTAGQPAATPRPAAPKPAAPPVISQPAQTTALPDIKAALPERVKKRLQRQARRSGSESAGFDAVWRHFFFPFFDPANYRRFGILLVSGFFAMAMFSFLYHYMIKVTEAGSGVDYSFFLFYGLFLAAFLPLALWGVSLLLSGVSIFEATKDGFSKIERWIPFRVEFASHYLFWLIVVSWIAPFPGTILSLALSRFGVSCTLGSVELIQIPILGSAAFFLFGPIFFLSIAANDKGFEIYHAGVWKSVARRFGLWLFYYAVATILLISMLAAWFGTFFFINYSVEQRLLAMAPLYIGMGAVLTLVTTVCLLVGFRLLGALAWSIHHDNESTRR